MSAPRLFFLILSYFWGINAQATNYIFPGNLPTGCSGSNGTYSCGSLSLGSSDTIAIAAPKPATITINGDLTTNITAINSSGTASDLNLTVKGLLTAGYQSIFNANITADSVSDSSGFVTFGGDITTSSGKVSLNFRTTVAGSITTSSGAITIGQEGVVGGNITSNGKVNIGYAARVATVTSSSDITFEQASASSSCVKSTGSAPITLGYQSTINSVCCGSSCGNSCVTNNSTYNMPAACSASLLAQYHFEESEWKDISGEVKDSSGNNRHANTIGSPLPSPVIASPAITGTTGTCGYASLLGPTSNGGAITMPNLPVDTSAGAKTTLSFWMYWNGTTNVDAFSWNRYTLWLRDGAFGFSTGNTDIYGIPSTTLASGWHHVVAVFTNGTVTSNKLYIDGVNRTLSQQFGTPRNSNAVVKSTLQMGGWESNTNYRFAGSMDEVKIYNGEVSQTTVSGLYKETHACPVPPVLVSEYRMDEAFWSGSADEVTDSVSKYSGTAASLDAIRPTTASTTPAIPKTPGTCNYGEFTRGSKNYVALPSSFPDFGADGTGFSITAWIKTTDNTQSGQRILIDDEHNSSGYGFSLGDGGTGLLRFFSRGTPSALMLDTPYAIDNGIWYFVAAVIDVPNKTKYIFVYDSAGTKLAHVGMSWSETSFGSDTGIASIGGETNSATENNNSFGFSGNIDELRVYASVLTEDQLSEIRQKSRSCQPTSTGSLPTNFNCIESNTSAFSGHLYTKLARTPFSFDIAALKTDGSVETNFVTGASKNITVELVDGSGNAQCTSLAPLSPVISQTLSFAATDQGRKAIAPITVSKAYPNLRCRVTDANQSPSMVRCSADNFSVRPGAVTFTTTANAAGPSTTATPAIKAGAAFTINALTATNASDGYTGILPLDSTKLSAQLPGNSGSQQSGGAVGSLTVNPAVQANVSPSQSNNARWNEVGYLYAAAGAFRDDNYTLVDQAAGDCISSTSANAYLADSFDSNNKIGCSIGNKAVISFGRFIPDHFAITPGTSTPGCGSTFTYFGQDGFNTSFSLTAQNSANNTTSNYSGNFAKLGLTNWSNFNFTASSSLPSGSILSASATSPTGAWNSGVASIVAKHQISRPTALTGETNVFISAAPTDSDGVTMATTQISTATPLRYGRINLTNALGSELVDLEVPMQAEYFNDFSFINNSDDSCSVAKLTIADPDATDSLLPADTCVWDDSATSGSFNCSIAAPINKSYREAASLTSGNFNLNLKSPGKTGSLEISAAVATWLQFDWQGTGNINPNAKATFGIYKGNPEQIYFREAF